MSGFLKFGFLVNVLVWVYNAAVIKYFGEYVRLNDLFKEGV